MQEHESPADDGRRAQLTAAAEALVAWVHAQRATWSSLPVDTASDVRPSLPLPDAPVSSSPPKIAASVVGHDMAHHDLPPAKVRPATPVVPLKVPAHARSLWQPLIRWTSRLAVAAAVVAIVGIAGLGAYQYWLRVTATPKTGTAVLESVPLGSDVVVDGAAAGLTPLTIELTPGRHVVEFRRGNATRKLEIEVAAGRSTVERLDWTAKPTGRLVVQSDPAGARVLIDGRARGVTPLTVDGLSVGSHAVVLESDQGSVRRTVAVRSDRPAQITESIYAGWLKVFAPFEVQITEGTRAIRLDDRSQVMLPPGPHELQLENRALGYRETRRVEVEPGQVTSLSLVPPSSTLTVTATLPAEVLIDGARVGETPLTNQPITLGTRDIVVRSAAGGERRFTMPVTVTPVRIDVDFSKP